MTRCLVVTKGLNVRSTPEVQADNRVASLPMGHEVDVAAPDSAGWTSVVTTVDGAPVKGFVASRYLTPFKAPPEPAFADELDAVLSFDALTRIMPRLRADTGRAYLPHLQRAMLAFSITTPPRKAAFLAQLAHESGELRYMEELADGTAYEGRIKSLGNTQPGDGPRYKGRGPIQLTGRRNYTTYSPIIGVDLVAFPELAALPIIGFRVAAAFWRENGLNEAADKPGNFTVITQIINGGTNHLADRQAYHARAKDVLGVPASFATDPSGLTDGSDPACDPSDPRLVPRLPRGAPHEIAILEARGLI